MGVEAPIGNPSGFLQILVQVRKSEGCLRCLRIPQGHLSAQGFLLDAPPLPGPNESAPDLSDIDLVKRALLERAPTKEPFSSADARKWLCEKRDGAFLKLGEKLPQVLSGLIADGLLEDQPCSSKKGRGHNKHIKMVRKREAVQVMSSESAEIQRKRLIVGLVFFA